MGEQKGGWSKRAALLAVGLSWPLQGKRFGFLLGAVLFALGIAGGCYAWRLWGGLVVQDQRFLVSPENIEVTPQPPWIDRDVKLEVIRDGSLDAVSLLDPMATVTVARAFRMHAWVADVQRVIKQYGPKVIVHVRYREPVAMVEVPADGNLPPGWLPVDIQGVLLPTDDFTSEQVRLYPRISAEGSAPAQQVVGTTWSDPRIAAAAQIAAIVGPHWEEFQLHRIIAPPVDPRRSAGNLSFELLTRQSVRILWGRPPGQEVSGEPSAAQKLETLERLLQRTAAQRSPSSPIDLRTSR